MSKLRTYNLVWAMSSIIPKEGDVTKILGTLGKKTIRLGEKDYQLSPLNLNILANIEEEFDCGLDKLGPKLEKRQASTLRKLIYILLKDQYPDMTLSKIGELIDLNNMAEVSEALAKVLAGD